MINHSIGQYLKQVEKKKKNHKENVLTHIVKTTKLTRTQIISLFRTTDESHI